MATPKATKERCHKLWEVIQNTGYYRAGCRIEGPSEGLWLENALRSHSPGLTILANLGAIQTIPISVGAATMRRNLIAGLLVAGSMVKVEGLGRQ